MAGEARAAGLDSPAPASAAGGGAGGAAPGGAGARGVSEKFGGKAGARGGLSTPTRVTGRLRSRGQGLRKGERREACGRRGAQGAQTPRTPPGGPGLGRSRAPPACPRGGTTGARGAGQLQEEGAADGPAALCDERRVTARLRASVAAKGVRGAGGWRPGEAIAGDRRLLVSSAGGTDGPTVAGENDSAADSLSTPPATAMRYLNQLAREARTRPPAPQGEEREEDEGALPAERSVTPGAESPDTETAARPRHRQTHRHASA